jgi:peptidyl-prolyl cis-trans isomerase SDCCAG10
MSFQKKLSTAKEDEDAAAAKRDQPPCEIHGIPGCESCRDTTQDAEEDVSDAGWISHKLMFEKDLKGKDLMKRRETVDDYVVIDPRDREAKAKQEEYERKRGIKSSSSTQRRDRMDYDDKRYRTEKRPRSDRHRRSRSRDRYDDRRR